MICIYNELSTCSWLVAWVTSRMLEPNWPYVPESTQWWIHLKPSIVNSYKLLIYPNPCIITCIITVILLHPPRLRRAPARSVGVDRSEWVWDVEKDSFRVTPSNACILSISHAAFIRRMLRLESLPYCVIPTMGWPGPSKRRGQIISVQNNLQRVVSFSFSSGMNISQKCSFVRFASRVIPCDR